MKGSFIAAICVLLQIVTTVEGKSWGLWKECVSGNCWQHRVKECTLNGIVTSKIKCVAVNETFEQILSNECSVQCNGKWNYSTITVCNGSCYDSTSVDILECSNHTTCRRFDYKRCYKESSCTGTWLSNENPKCSKECGGGINIHLLRCFEGSLVSSYNCNGTNGNITAESRLETTQPCNPLPCPTWSEWVETASCPQSQCGENHSRLFTSECTYGQLPSTLCDAERKKTTRTRNEVCSQDCTTLKPSNKTDSNPLSTTTLQGTTSRTTTEKTVTLAPIIIYYAAAGGGGGFLIIVITIVVTVCVVKKKRKAEKQNNGKEKKQPPTKPPRKASRELIEDQDANEHAINFKQEDITPPVFQTSPFQRNSDKSAYTTMSSIRSTSGATFAMEVDVPSADESDDSWSDDWPEDDELDSPIRQQRLTIRKSRKSKRTSRKTGQPFKPTALPTTYDTIHEVRQAPPPPEEQPPALLYQAKMSIPVATPRTKRPT